MRYPWPGNVRELENEMRRLGALNVGEVTLENLAPVFKGGRAARPRLGDNLQPLEAVVTNAERGAIERALRVCGGNKSQTAHRLGITRKALYRRLAKYGIGSPTGAA